MQYRSRHMRAQRHALATLTALRKERREAVKEESKQRQEQMKELLLQDKLERSRKHSSTKRDRGAGVKQSHFQGQVPGSRCEVPEKTGGRKGPGSTPKAA